MHSFAEIQNGNKIQKSINVDKWTERKIDKVRHYSQVSDGRYFLRDIIALMGPKLDRFIYCFFIHITGT
jgi:hypothetical protein